MRSSPTRYILDHTRSTAKYLQEANLCRTYGLKTKRELGVARALLQKYRAVVKSTNPAVILPAVAKLVSLGLLETPSKEQILTLTIESFLDRRLQTLVTKKLKITPRAARQLITHGHVTVAGIKKKFPGYLIRVSNENLLQITT